MQRFPEIQICTFIITAVFLLLLFLNTQRTGTLQCPLQHMATFIPDTQQLPGHQTKGWFKGWFFLQISFRFPRVINCYATNSIKTLKSNVRKLFFGLFSTSSASEPGLCPKLSSDICWRSYSGPSGHTFESPSPGLGDLCVHLGSKSGVTFVPKHINLLCVMSSNTHVICFIRKDVVGPSPPDG